MCHQREKRKSSANCYSSSYNRQWCLHQMSCQCIQMRHYTRNQKLTTSWWCYREKCQVIQFLMSMNVSQQSITTSSIWAKAMDQPISIHNAPMWLREITLTPILYSYHSLYTTPLLSLFSPNVFITFCSHLFLCSLMHPLISASGCGTRSAPPQAGVHSSLWALSLIQQDQRLPTRDPFIMYNDTLCLSAAQSQAARVWYTSEWSSLCRLPVPAAISDYAF